MRKHTVVCDRCGKEEELVDHFLPDVQFGPKHDYSLPKDFVELRTRAGASKDLCGVCQIVLSQMEARFWNRSEENASLRSGDSGAADEEEEGRG